MQVKKKILIVTSLIALIVMCVTPVGAFIGVHKDRLEVDGEVLGKAIDVAQLDNIRGTYMGFNFSVLFEGFWDSLGNYDAVLITGGNTPPGNSIAPSFPNSEVNIQASVGDFGNSRGIFFITQVPGSGNLVQSNLLINIQVIQVMGDTIPNLPTLPW
jgi:hypothetical protein